MGEGVNAPLTTTLADSVGNSADFLMLSALADPFAASDDEEVMSEAQAHAAVENMERVLLEASRRELQVEAERECSRESTMQVGDRTVTLYTADCQRASREGRPSLPSAAATRALRSFINARRAELEASGRRLLDTAEFGLSGPLSTSKWRGGGTAMRSLDSNVQSKLNHLATLKNRNHENYNSEPAYLLNDRTAESRRINSRSVGVSAAAQCAVVQLTIAVAKARLLANGHDVRDPLTIIGTDPSKLIGVRSETATLLVASTSQLIYNARPTKLATGSIRGVAMALARAEIGEDHISCAMQTPRALLFDLCSSCLGGREIDGVWSCVVLIVFLSCDPRGRRLLAATSLTDLDLQTALILEGYGRAEISRRSKLAESQRAETLGEATAASKEATSVFRVAFKRRGKVGQKRSRANDALLAVPTKKTAVAVDAAVDAAMCAEVERVLEAACQETIGFVSDGPRDGPRDGPNDDTPATCELGTAHAAEADGGVVGGKRRRILSQTGVSDSHSCIVWWTTALRSSERSVLETLIASSRDAAREAAHATLVRQSQNEARVYAHSMLRSIAATNAVRSIEGVVSFVHRPLKEIPPVVAMKLAGGVAVGIAPIAEQANSTVLHAATLPPQTIRPHPHAQIVVLNSTATQELAPRSPDGAVVPGVAERYVTLAALKTANSERRVDGERSFHNRRVVSGLERFIDAETHVAITSTAAGITRSFIALKLQFPFNASVWESATLLVQEAELLHKAQAAVVATEVVPTDGRPQSTTLLAVSRSLDHRVEPLCAPCSRLGVGVRLNELLRRWLVGRTRKNYPARVLSGVCVPASAASKDIPAISDTEPLPLAIITDFNLTVDTLPTPSSTPSVAVRHHTVGATLHVCLDGATRVPELLQRVADVFQRRALLYTAASQASYIADVGSAVAANSANTSIANSKKIACADCACVPLLSFWDCYVGGLLNVQRNYATTPYSQVAGPHVDTGVSPPGLLGNYLRADHRAHGNLSLSRAAADELSDVIIHSHFVEVGKSHFVQAPLETRGVPHMLVPDVHAVLNDYVAALETCRQITEREEESTCDGIFALSFSGFTQNLAPDIESAVDSTLRHAFRDPAHASTASGRSYLADSTAEDMAILTEPLWRRPCSASVADNPFTTSYSAAEGVWTAVNTIAGIVVATNHEDISPDALVDGFHAFMSRMILHTKGTGGGAAPPAAVDGADRTSRIWIADALVMLSSIFPHSHAIDQPLILPAIARLAAKMATACKRRTNGKRIAELLSESDLADVQTFWRKFDRPSAGACVWSSGIKPLLSLILAERGGHDISKEKVVAFRAAIDGVVRAAWLFYSDDGVGPPPAPHFLSGVRSPQHIRRTHLDCVYFAEVGEDGVVVPPRGTLVGTQPFQMRQLFTLLMGAHLDGVDAVQAIRNEGGLSLRLSSAADLLESNGSFRTRKATAPTQCEDNVASFGDLKSKLYGCSLQRSAWDRNVLLLAHVFAAINPPATSDKRARGEFGEVQLLRSRIVDAWDEGQIASTAEEKSGRRSIELACATSASDEFREVRGA